MAPCCRWRAPTTFRRTPTGSMPNCGGRPPAPVSVKQVAALRAAGHDPAEIAHLCVDGTSGTMVLTDADLTPGQPRADVQFQGVRREAARIAAVAPDPHIARGSGSALGARHAPCQRSRRAAPPAASGRFHRRPADRAGGLSDVMNALKTGVDPETGAWPDWIAVAAARRACCPRRASSARRSARSAPTSPAILAWRRGDGPCRHHRQHRRLPRRRAAGARRRRDLAWLDARDQDAQRRRIDDPRARALFAPGRRGLAGRRCLQHRRAGCCAISSATPSSPR
jgi:hypothetical protein